jgi:serine/threonine protein kinase
MAMVLYDGRTSVDADFVQHHCPEVRRRMERGGATRARELPSLEGVLAYAPELTQAFDLDGVLGAGGMGVVLSARDRRQSRRVAIKLVRDSATADSKAKARLVREARLAGALRSRHAVRVFEVGTLRDGVPFLVMEQLEGMDLARRLRAGALEIGEAVDIVVQACAAIAEAHSMGIIHRDLKPSNLFLVDGPSLAVKVLDFGVAREVARRREGSGSTETTTGGGPFPSTLTESGVVIGSPAYMAPEQVRGLRALDGRVDLWSLGVILYEALAGAVPFHGASVPDTLVRIASEAHVPLLRVAPSIPRGLAGAVETCLEKERERRPESAAGLVRLLAPYATARSAEALAAVLESNTTPDEPSTRVGALSCAVQGWFEPEAEGRPLRVRRERRAALIGAGVLAAGLGGGFFWDRASSPPARLEERAASAVDRAAAPAPPAPEPAEPVEPSREVGAGAGADRWRAPNAPAVASGPALAAPPTPRAARNVAQPPSRPGSQAVASGPDDPLRLDIRP